MECLSGKSSFRVYTKAETNCSLAIRNGQVILARVDHSDPFQHWVKDERSSSDFEDEQGFPSFALVNKATGQVMKHSVGAAHPVQLIPYVPDELDESVLWTLGGDVGDGYRAMRMVNNIRLNVDAFHDGSIHDGTIIGLWQCGQGENQLWKMVPHQDVPKHQVWDRLTRMPSVRVYTKAETNCSLAIRDGKVILARANLSDPSQHWLKDEKYSTEVKDEYGFPSFALVNKATRQAMKPVGATHPVELIPYVPDVYDESVLWTLATDLGDGYRAMRMVNNTRLNVDAFHDGSIHDGTFIGLWEWGQGENQLWKMVPHQDVPTHHVLDRLSQMPSVRVYTKAETSCSLAIRDGKVILARADPSDPSQIGKKRQRDVWYSTIAYIYVMVVRT